MTRTIRLHLQTLLVCLLVFASNTAAISQESANQSNETLPDTSAEKSDSASESSTQNTAERKKDLDSFNIVWDTIIKTWWKNEEDLTAWKQQKQSFLERVESAENRKQVRKLQGELIKNLKASHYGIIPGEVYEKLGVQENGELDPSQLGSVGLEFRLVNNQALVYHVAEGSPAEKAGVRAGWLLQSIKDQDIPDVIAKLETALEETNFPLASIVGLRLSNACNDSIDEQLKLVMLDEEDKSHELELTMTKPTGKWIRFGNLPPMLLDIDSKTLNNDIEYFSFSAFFDPVSLMPQFDAALDKARKSKKLVIDLRGNRGGIGGLTMGMGRHFVKEDQYLGKMKFPKYELKFALAPTPEPFEGKVAVLTDECSFSSAEIMAGGLQAIGRARVFGTRTAGAALPSVVKKLPNGDFFQYAICDYVNADGSRIEGNGVAPNEEIPLTRKDLLGNKDRTLEAATAWLNN